MKQQALHKFCIANVVKWISLVDRESLGGFVGKGLTDSKHLWQLMSDEGKIWQMSEVGRNFRVRYRSNKNRSINW